MVDQSIITEGLNKQFKLIECTRRRWDDAVTRSDEVFTSIAYNLMRESIPINSGGSVDELWSLKLVMPFAIFLPQFTLHTSTFLVYHCNSQVHYEL